MSRLGKSAPAMNWRVVAALACVTLAAGPGLAASRHAPHAHQPAGQGSAPGGNAPAPAPSTKPNAGDPSGAVDTSASKASPTAPVDRGGKTTDGKSVGPIDLTRPDDGYGNLRRRAIRPSLVAAQKKLQTVAPATIAPHPAVSATAEHVRNATGAAVPAVPIQPGLGAARPEPVHTEPTPAFGGAKNNLGLSPTGAHPVPVHVATTPAPPKAPVAGINGTGLHPANAGIGGPAKDRSAIAGSSYRHK
jgi:hypothetical protein